MIRFNSNRDSQRSVHRYVILVSLFLAVPTPADSNVTAAQKVFVPFAPYMDANRAAIKTEMLLKGQCTEQVIDALLDNAEQTGYMFSVESMANAFPMILNSDQLNIGCTQPQVRMEFISVMSTNTVMVKTLDCDAMPAGMLCTLPIESLRYFLAKPSNTIELSGGATFEEATEILEWFKQDAADYFSEAQARRLRQLSWRVGIGKDAKSYMLRIGDPYCECILTMALNRPDILAKTNQFTLVGEPQFTCPHQYQAN